MAFQPTNTAILEHIGMFMLPEDVSERERRFVRKRKWPSQQINKSALSMGVHCSGWWLASLRNDDEWARLPITGLLQAREAHDYYKEAGAANLVESRIPTVFGGVSKERAEQRTACGRSIGIPLARSLTPFRLHISCSRTIRSS